MCTCAVQHCLWGPGKVLAGCHSNPDHQQNARCLKTYCWRHWVSGPSLHGLSHSTLFPWCLLVSERAHRQETEGIFYLLNFAFHEKGIINAMRKMFLINQNEMSKVVVFDWHYSIQFLASVLTLASSLLANSPCHLPVASLRSSLSSWQIRLTPPSRAAVGCLLHLCFTTVILSLRLGPLALFSSRSPCFLRSPTVRPGQRRLVGGSPRGTKAPRHSFCLWLICSVSSLWPGCTEAQGILKSPAAEFLWSRDEEGERAGRRERVRSIKAGWYGQQQSVKFQSRDENEERKDDNRGILHFWGLPFHGLVNLQKKSFLDTLFLFKHQFA